MQASFAYDADGNRVAQQNASGTTSYLLDSGGGLANVIEEVGPGGTTGYEYGAGLLRSVFNGSASEYLQDAVGSTRAIAQGGAVTSSMSYDAFGSPLASVSDGYLFNGQHYDSATGLYYLRARYYRPGLGRFISQDPADGDGMSPVSLHRYLYAGGDPVNSADPSGLDTASQIGTYVHNAIGLDFMTDLGSGAFCNKAIGTVLGFPICIVPKFPDLAYYPKAFAFEIKPSSPVWLAVGRAQLHGYLDLLSANDKRGLTWRPGTAADYMPPTVLANAIVFPPFWGVIEYYRIDPTNSLLRELVQEAAEELRELVKAGEVDWDGSLQTVSNIEAAVIGAAEQNAESIGAITALTCIALLALKASVPTYTGIASLTSTLADGAL